MKVITTKVKAKELKEGELFTNSLQFDWDNIQDKKAIGKSVWIRTKVVCPPKEENVELLKIEIKKVYKV